MNTRRRVQIGNIVYKIRFPSKCFYILSNKKEEELLRVVAVNKRKLKDVAWDRDRKEKNDWKTYETEWEKKNVKWVDSRKCL